MQVQAKAFFLTYPQCPLQPDEVLLLLRACQPVPIVQWVVATELHQDGNPHVHAWIQYEKKITYKTTLWDLKKDNHVYHGNYQQSKSSEKCRQYCAKDGHYISSMDLNAKQKKKAARNKELLTEDLKQLIDSGEIGLKELPVIQRARDAYQSLQPPLRTENVRGVWIVGRTGVGKTHYVRTRHTPAELYLKGQNKWFCGYTGQPAVLIDDVDHAGATKEFGHLLKKWADKWGESAEVKGGRVNLQHTVLYVTSQYEIGELFHDDDELRDALTRRFVRIGLSTRMDPKDIEKEFDDGGAF